MEPTNEAGKTRAAAWNRGTVPESEYEEIARALGSAESPVGIDAKHTHVLILHALDRIERRLTDLEDRMDAEAPTGGGATPRGGPSSR